MAKLTDSMAQNEADNYQSRFGGLQLFSILEQVISGYIFEVCNEYMETTKFGCITMLRLYRMLIYYFHT